MSKAAALDVRVCTGLTDTYLSIGVGKVLVACVGLCTYAYVSIYVYVCARAAGRRCFLSRARSRRAPGKIDSGWRRERVSRTQAAWQAGRWAGRQASGQAAGEQAASPAVREIFGFDISQAPTNVRRYSMMPRDARSIDLRRAALRSLARVLRQLTSAEPLIEHLCLMRFGKFNYRRARRY